MTKRGGLLPLLFAATNLLLVPPLAADWRVAKGVSASVTHTDNADVSDDERRDESVLSLSPYVRLDATGRRSELSLSGQVELQRFVDEARTEIEPVIALATRTDLVERFATLDTAARVSQRSIDAGPLSDDVSTRPDEETEQTYEIGFSPSLSDTVGDRTRYRTSYRFASVRGSDDRLVGSDTHGVSARVLSIAGGDVILLAGGEYDVVRFENDDSAHTAFVGVGAGYRFRPTVLGFVAVGRDWTRPGESVDTLEDDLWNVGLRWQPSTRFRAALGYGERTYGRRPSASVTLIGRRSTIELAWSRELAFVAGSGSFDVLSPIDADVDGAGTLAERDDSELIDGEPLSPFAREAFSVDEKVDLSYGLRGQRSTLSASLAWARREQLDTGLVTDGRELELGFTRSLSSRTDVAASWQMIDSDFSDERERTRENRFRLSLRIAL